MIRVEDVTETGGGGGGGGVKIVSPKEAERMVESLSKFSIAKVGSAKWIRQHGVLSKLNLQAHQSVASKTDNFVLESFVTFDKVSLLIHELLVAEIWSKRVFPLVKDELNKRRDGSIRAYFILYQQAVLVNILEIILYHDYVAESAGNDLVDLVDFCARQVTYLNGRAHGRNRGKTELNAPLDGGDGIKRQADDIAFRVAVSSVAVLRYLTEHVTKLPLCVMSRILDTHDVCIAAIPLIENPPWTRRRRRKIAAPLKGMKSPTHSLSSGSEHEKKELTKKEKKTKMVWEKYGDSGRWEEVRPENLLRLTKNEAQVWLILYNLLCEGKCRKAYPFTSHRKDSILRVRKYINEVLLDQLPVLSHVQRYLDELSIMEVPASANTQSRFLLEQVASTRDAILKDCRDGFEKVGTASLEQVFGKESDPASLDALKEIAAMYGDDAVMSVFSPQTADDDAKKNSSPVDTKKSESREVGLVGAIVSLGDKTESYQYIVRKGTAARVMQTSCGTFRRYHMTLLKSAPPVDPDAKASVTPLDGSGEPLKLNESVLDLCAPLDAPKMTSSALSDTAAPGTVRVDTSLPASTWVKMGTLEEGVVVQLKLKRRIEVLPKYASRGCAYGLSDLFISVANSRSSICKADAGNNGSRASSASSTKESDGDGIARTGGMTRIAVE
eukprot:g865.t1